MTATVADSWLVANQRYLMAALDRAHGYLARFLGQAEGVEPDMQLHQQLQQIQAEMDVPPAIERLRQICKLSTFEQFVLLLCAGLELDSRFIPLLSTLQGDPQRSYVTFSAALAVLPNPHWNALTPTAALRRYQLIEVGAGVSLTLSPLRLDERILHYLTGTQYLDARLLGLIEPLTTGEELVPSQQELVAPIAAVLSNALQDLMPPVIQFCGAEMVAKRALAFLVCDRLQLNLWSMPAHVVPTLPSDLDQFIRLWTRETLFSNSVLLLDCGDLDVGDPAQLTRLTHLIERLPSLYFITCRDRLRLPNRPVVPFDLHKPTSAEQYALWQATLQTCFPSLNGQFNPHLHTLTSQFNLSAATIRTVCGNLAPDQEDTSATLPNFTTLWDTCRYQNRPRLDELAQRIDPKADWKDLVLPENQTQILREAAAHVRRRATVYGQWGFAERDSRGLGISALFAGSSGTGKTLAAEVLAHELRLDLYRVDLSSVVSKYIGETEKNLRQVFDAAEDGGVILLFDEADALFGKRSEVKDSRDRYANIEVSYLLQRMECYPGLAILTTNLKSAIDTAFLRRIRFVVQFPFPDTNQRAEIWRRIFPKDTPTEALEPLKLAQLNVAGGNIRNIALNAAFLAADAEQPVGMKHVLQAAKTEYAKLEKTLTESEIGGWL
ncbi:ATP-binding protein [Phormidium tenue FACHB-886]|nr:ATP-binding protein [Phormidium tenue FACHB-886]